MTEQNMKQLYEHYVNTGQTARAQEILNIPRYAKFKEQPEVISREEVRETKSKKVK